jgi:hypothetical protein
VDREEANLAVARELGASLTVLNRPPGSEQLFVRV